MAILVDRVSASRWQSVGQTDLDSGGYGKVTTSQSMVVRWYVKKIR